MVRMEHHVQRFSSKYENKRHVIQHKHHLLIAELSEREHLPPLCDSTHDPRARAPILHFHIFFVLRRFVHLSEPPVRSQACNDSVLDLYHHAVGVTPS